MVTSSQEIPAAVLAQIKSGYAFDGPVIILGALLPDGETPDPEAMIRIPVSMTNRHGLVAGATGTGKTKTLQLMAEQLSDAGVPVFLADIKGDVSGMAAPGETNDKLSARTQSLGQDWQPKSFPVEFFSLGGHGTGVPLRATMTDFGPTLLAKVLGLNPTQESSLNLVFHFADNNGLPLLDVKDLRAVIQYLTSDEGAAALKSLGGLSKPTAGVLLRELITFSDQGADDFFGEPECDSADFLRTTNDGRGVVSVLELPGVVNQPALFSTFLMWLLADLYRELPEVGDIDKPKLVFFFDEAHLLFKDASKAFLESVTQTVRLIRSKGIGVFFVTQTPKDVHPDVLAQLGSRVQHALRAFTPDDAKALKAAASTFPKSAYDLEEDLTQLGIGEAMVTVMSEKGTPTPVAWTRLWAPESLMAAADPSALTNVVNNSLLYSKYANPVDRDSAYEILSARLRPGGVPAQPPAGYPPAAPPNQPQYYPQAPVPGYPPAPANSRARAPKPPVEQPTMMEKVLGSTAAKSLVRSAATVAGAAIVREIFGTAKRTKKKS